jgi:hypothetical protein
MRRFDAEKIADFVRVRKFPVLFEDAKLEGGYDLVFLIHSIFAFQDANTFEKVLRLRGESGFIILVTNAGDSFLAGLKRILDHGYVDRRFEIDDLLRILRVREILFDIRQFQTTWKIRQDSLDTDGRAIEEWLSLGRRKPEEISRTFRSYILDRSSPVGEARLFSEDEVVVLIPPIPRMERF